MLVKLRLKPILLIKIIIDSLSNTKTKTNRFIIIEIQLYLHSFLLEIPYEHFRKNS